ncbi:MATE family efflux transporter [Patescibacteria group bacterium]|nr:MATE family efflux transporter [Patescibacteria group bacterium]MBU1721618.1 MATE family efflux transporter [Patescibacteria group bacterium]MBU1901720.1 MATE family efflux transporter [Patescibacteria group bacterium]
MKKPNLTKGSITKTLIYLSLPIIFANILQTAYQLTDTFWVGRLGTVAVAAVSVSFPVIFFLIALGMGLAMSGTILVSQFRGKGDDTIVDHITGQTLALIGVISVVLSIVGYIFSPMILRFMGIEGLLFQDALSYMQISFIGMLFMFVYMVFESVMRGIGQVKIPVYIVASTVLLNLILDPLFIFGYGIIPGFGVGGAAVASTITQALSAIIGMYFLIRGSYGVRLHLKDFVLDFPLIKKMFHIGWPSSVEHSSRALRMLLMTILVAYFGTQAIAAYGIGARILSFVIIPALGLAIATSAIVGQNIGAGKKDRAEKTVNRSMILGFSALTMVGVVIFIFAEPLSAFFIPGETETIAMSAQFVRIMALFFGTIPLQMSVNGAFRGAGKTIVPMFLSLISLIVFQFPIAFYLSRYTELREMGIWWSFPISNFFAALMSILWFKTGSWKKKDIMTGVGEKK